MFGLFKKKKKEKEPENAPQGAAPAARRLEESIQLRAFSSQFLPREMTIQAVTGASEFDGSRAGNKEVWIASTSLTAWKEEGSDEVHRGNFTLTSLGDDDLLNVLRKRIPWDSLIKFRGRVSEDGTYLLLLDLPEKGNDLELKTILAKQKQTVSFDVEGLGTFYLNRQTNWFETEVDWLGTNTILFFYQEEENRDSCTAHARALVDDMVRWDRQVRECAADEFHNLANEWTQWLEEEEGFEPLTREEFMARLELASIEVRSDSSLEFWFNDDGMFYGHSIHVSADLGNGPKKAEMEV